MSFILDALKKSESDRQRQGGPALFEVKVAAPRHALPTWAAAVAVLFVANLVVVGWLLLRRAATPAEAPPPSAAVARAQAGPAPAPPAPAALAAAATTAPVAVSAPAAVGPAVTAPSRGGTTALARTPAEGMAASGAAEATSAAESGPNPEDFAPAAEPSASAGLGRVKRGSDVPLYAQLAATPGLQLPQLRLDLHAYAERAEDRWVLINMHKLHEGDSLEGVRVERITPDGAVLSYQGSEFLLTRQ